MGKKRITAMKPMPLPDTAHSFTKIPSHRIYDYDISPLNKPYDLRA